MGCCCSSQSDTKLLPQYQHSKQMEIQHPKITLALPQDKIQNIQKISQKQNQKLDSSRQIQYPSCSYSNKSNMEFIQFRKQKVNEEPHKFNKKSNVSISTFQLKEGILNNKPPINNSLVGAKNYLLQLQNPTFSTKITETQKVGNKYQPSNNDSDVMRVKKWRSGI